MALQPGNQPSLKVWSFCLVLVLGLWGMGVPFHQGLTAIHPGLPSSGNGNMDCRPEASQRTTVRPQTGQLPMIFEPNQGQVSGDLDYMARGVGYTLGITDQELVLALNRSTTRTSPVAEQVTLRMQFRGSQPAQAIKAEELQPTVKHYLRGNDPGGWHRNIPTYGRVRYQGIYPGVDVVYYGREHHLEYDLEVKPGVDPGIIRIRLAGASRLSLDAEGNLMVKVGGGTVRQPRPVAYQEINGSRQHVAANYRLYPGQELGFALGVYDQRYPVVIDPVLEYATYLGGTEAEAGYRTAIDGEGNVYVVGMTRSPGFPVQAGLQATSGGDLDVCVAKLNAAGTGMVYATYLGGDGTDAAHGLLIDPNSGDITLTGVTRSTNFPTTETAYQPTLAGGYDAFVAQVSSDGRKLAYSTYL